MTRHILIAFLASLAVIVLLATKVDYRTQISGGPDPNPSLSPTTAQAGTPWICLASFGKSNPFKCRMSPTQSTYPPYQFLVFVPDVPCGTVNSLSVDELGPIPLVKQSGAPLGLNECATATPYMLLAHGGTSVDSFIVMGVQ